MVLKTTLYSTRRTMVVFRTILKQLIHSLIEGLEVVTRELQFSIILGDPYDISDCTNKKAFLRTFCYYSRRTEFPCVSVLPKQFYA